MTDTIIEVENLSKLYRLGATEARYKTFRESIMGALLGPFRRRSVGEANERKSDELWALKDVCFDVKQGEVVGIIGRNGAGKSTLLKILSRITDPTEGRVRLNGRVGSLLEVGTGFHPELSGRENIYMNGAILGMRKAEIARKFDDIVAFAEVEKFIDTPVKRYSSGMYTRLAFAVAAHMEPEILVVDEVLAVGDAEFQKKCLGKMKDVGAEGRTVLFVSHNLSYVSKLCTKGILLDRGQVRYEGAVDSTIDEYLSKSASSESRISLADFKSVQGHGAVGVLSLELVNSIGSNFACAWDEPLQLRILLKANDRVEGISMGVGCTTVDFVPLFTVRSADANSVSLNMRAGEEKNVLVAVDHNLRAGFFNLVLGIASGNYAHYYNPSAAQLQIMDVGQRPYPDKNPGLIHCSAQWSVN